MHNHSNPLLAASCPKCSKESKNVRMEHHEGTQINGNQLFRKPFQAFHQDIKRHN